MIIVDQENKTILNNYIEIFINDSADCMNGILARTLDGTICTLGEYARLSRTQMVFNEIVEAYTKGKVVVDGDAGAVLTVINLVK